MIDPTTAAFETVIDLSKFEMPVTIFVIGELDTDEEIAIKYHDTTAWRQANINETDLKLSSTGQLMTWWDAMPIQFVKSTTDAAVGVGVRS